MSNDGPISPEEFERLLNWLSKDRDQAGEKYELIRRTLIKIFGFRACVAAEELADETINRVARNLLKFINEFEGPPERVFINYAHKIYLEYLRKQSKPLPPAPPGSSSEEREEEDREYDCFERCLDKLEASDRELVIEYYDGEKRTRIDRRKALAERKGISLNSLRLQVFRLRTSLEKCICECRSRSKN